MIIDGRKFYKDVNIDTDVVIIGSGAGGAPAAYRFAKAGKKVLVMEEGGKFTEDYFNKVSPYQRV